MNAATIKQLCNKQVPTIFKDEKIEKALNILEKTKSAALVILEKNSKAIGIITERDIAKKAGHWDEILTKPVSSLMSSPLFTLKETTNFAQAYMMMSEHGYRHIVVLDEDEKLLGILGEDDFLKHLTLEQLLGVKEVEQVMSKEVMTAREDETVAQIIQTMTTHKISSIVIIKDNKPLGIFTERDAVHLARYGDKNLSTSIAKHMASPVSTIKQNYSVLDAERILKQKKIRRLVVVDEKGELAGILTQHDLVKGISGTYIKMLRDTIHKQKNIIHETNNRLEEQSVLKNILHSFTDKFIIACDINSVIEYTNTCTLELPCKVPKIGELLNEDVKCFKKEIAASILNGDVNTTIHKLAIVRSENGSISSFKTSYAPIFSEQKLLQGFLFSAEDVTNEQKTYNDLKILNDKLEQSEQRFKKIFDSAKNGILLVDIKERKFYMGNQAICEMLGYSSDEIQVLGIEDIHPKEVLEDVLENIKKQIAGEQKTLKDIVVKRKDSSLFYADISAEMITIDNQTLIVKIFNDVTERKEYEKLLETKNMQLKERETQLLQAQDIAKIGNWSLDIKSMEADWSDEMREICGIDTDVSVGPEFLSKIVYPEDWTKLYASLMDTANSGKLHHMEYRIKRKTDHKTRWVDCHGKRVIDKNNIVKVVGTFQDITEQKEREHSLMRSEEKYKDLFEGINDAVFVSPFSEETFHNFIEVNDIACQKLGYTKEELLQFSVLDIIQEDDFDTPHTMNLRKKELITNGYAFFQTQTRTKRGKIIPVEVSTKIIYIEEKLFVMLMVRDISERKMAEKKLKEQEDIMIVQSRQAAMGEMISMIAHQWRQPISVVSMAANTILLDIALDEFKEENVKIGLDEINEQVQYMSHTIDDFRNFFQSSKTITKEKVVNIIHSVLKIIGPALQQNNIEIKIDCEESIMLETYQSELTQVIINLLSNAKDALKNTKEDKRINIDVKELDDRVVFSISNNGPKIPKEILNRIFEPYFTTKEKSGGTGLGLYMTKSIIEKHMAGSIQVENLDNGVKFTISILKELKEV